MLWQSVMKDGTLTTTNTTYKMVNTENPEEYVILASSGQGADSQDKGVGKAMTYSYKYLMLRTFAIPTGEDPDKIASEKIDDDDAIATIKKLIEETETDTTKFLYSMSQKFGRKVTSVDDMRGKTFGKNNIRELDHALSKMRDKEKEIKNEH